MLCNSWNLLSEYEICVLSNIRASLVTQTVKHLPAMQEGWVQFLGQEDPLEKGMATHSSILAWRTPWTEELVGYSPWGHNWEIFTSFHSSNIKWYTYTLNKQSYLVVKKIQGFMCSSIHVLIKNWKVHLNKTHPKGRIEKIY